MKTIRATLDIGFEPDFTDVFLDYVETKNAADYFRVSNMNTFLSEDEIYGAYGKMLKSFTDDGEALDTISDMILFRNDLGSDERLLEQVKKSIVRPFRTWSANVDYDELARFALKGQDVRPLIKGMTKRRKLLRRRSRNV